MKLSVIIPTYNRRESLLKCLAALERQTWKGELFEVVVVDDGSSDGTREAVSARPAGGDFEISYFLLDHKGPAAVRNEGIRRASGELLLFIGDDILAGPRLLEEHLNWHSAHPEEGTAVFGYVTWSPELRVTPFMHWLEHGGPGFRYYQFSHGKTVDVLWTCNISLKREFLLRSGAFFDEEFPYAAMEDIELGYRLRGSELKILFNKNAAAWHFHPTDILSYCVRQRLAGRSTRLFWDKYPEQCLAQPPMRRWKRVLMAVSPLLKWGIFLTDMAGIRLDPRVYDLVLDYYYRKGLGEELRGRL